MKIYSDPKCLTYHSPGHPERPTRVAATVAWLKERQPESTWEPFEVASELSLLRVHPRSHLDRLQEERAFDTDTAFHNDIFEIARLGTSSTLAAMESALSGEKAFSLMRPPGHHAGQTQAMGFCYLNHTAISAMEALETGIEKVAVWDFDAHHGNGTEAILEGVEGALYVSVHQHPCYPGTGTISRGNARNFPVRPGTLPEVHLEVLAKSWEAILDFEPGLVLVSAGFDAYELDPLTDMRLRSIDFETLGSWLAEAKIPVAATLEGGYSDDLPLLVEAFLKGWSRS
ncbi:MAG: histone deacetylase [Opitutaceae bacterium]|nr:histone deacetylase [Opitutaceae bacterium]